MNYGKHGVYGGLTGGAIILAAQRMDILAKDPLLIPLGIGVSALGAIAVDIDHPQAFISCSFLKKVLEPFLFVLLVLIMLATVGALSGASFMAILTPYQKWIQISVVGIAFVAMLRGVSKWTFKTLGHRGPLHSLFFSVLTATVASIVVNIIFDDSKWWLGLCFGWGWFSHVLIDKWFTVHAVSLWWPVE